MARFAHDGGAEGIGEDQSAVLRQDVEGKGLRHGEVEAVAESLVVGPFPVGPEIRDARFDLDDGEAAVRAERDDVGAAPVGEGELGQGRVAELREEPPDAALHAARHRRLAAVGGKTGAGCPARLSANRTSSPRFARARQRSATRELSRPARFSVAHPASTISAPFSAIIRVGELVLPEVMRGIAEASMTRSPSDAADPQPLVEHREGSPSTPILAVPTGWKIVVPISPAAATSSSSEARWAPGLYSSGLKRASGACATIRRVRRRASTATRRSSSVER